MNDANSSFDKVTILLHWVMALLIFFLFGLGLYMVDLSYYDPWYRDATALHKDLGICVLVLLIFRVIWRIFTYKKTASAQAPELKGIEKKLALTMHVLLYMLMFSISLTGYLISTAGGREIDVFSSIKLPALLFEIDRQEDIAGWWHFYLAWGIIIFVCGHTLAAFKHHFINKDNVLKSMLWSSKTKK